MPWYKGLCLTDAIDCLPAPVKPNDKPPKPLFQDIYKIYGVGIVPVGRVETGIIKPGMNVTFAPGDHKTDVKSVEQHHA